MLLWKKIGKLVLECEDETLKTTETLLDDKNNNIWIMLLPYLYYFIGIYMVVIIDLHLYHFFSCYFYYTKYRPNQKHLLPFNKTIIKLREMRY